MGLTREEVDARIATLSTRLAMKDILDVRIGKMSTGMLQKVSVSRVLLHEPEVLILDEPTTGLDVLAAREIVRVIGEWRDQGKTVIFSTHILREAERLCDTIAILEKGRILGTGSLAHLTEAHGPGDLEEVFIRLVEGAGARAEAAR
jgi:sodium transport system ATP-binding protein